jgi:hypothetical protein
MDDQNPVTVTPENSHSHPPAKKNVFSYLAILVLIVIVLLTLGFVTGFFQNLFYQPPISQVAQPTPSPTPQVTIMPYTTELQGVVTSVSANSISVSVNNQVKNFSFGQFFTVARLSSGQVDSPNAQFSKAKIEDLKVGQEVKLFGPIGSTEVSLIWILK